MNRKGDWIITYTGKKFYALDPQPEDIDIKDIAHALSMTCRFGGHSSRFYSVCEHSILVESLCSQKNKLAALLHDASEAYITDVPSPIKRGMPEYQVMENDIMTVIADKFGFQYPLSDEIEYIDHNIVATEANELWDIELDWTKYLEYISVNIKCWEPSVVKMIFLQRFKELTWNV